MTVTITIPDDIEKHLEFIPEEMLSDVLVDLVRKGIVVQEKSTPSKLNSIEISTDTLAEALKVVISKCDIQTYAKVENSYEKDYSSANIYSCSETSNSNTDKNVLVNEVIISSISDDDDDDDLDGFMDMMK